MNNSLRVKWLESLRSGKYKQTSRALVHEDSHCCLGVLCEISGLEKQGNGYVYLGSVFRYDPPDALFEELEETNFFGAKCVTQNDEEQMTFSEIADYWENEWEISNLMIE